MSLGLSPLQSIGHTIDSAGLADELSCRSLNNFLWMPRQVTLNLRKDASILRHTNNPTIFNLHRVKSARFFLGHYFL